MTSDGAVRVVRLGTRNVAFPSPMLGQLQDSNRLLGDSQALREELKDKGYLFIRGFHVPEEVAQARLAVLRYIREAGEGKLQMGHHWEAGVLDQRCGRGCLPFMEGVRAITHVDAVAKVLEGWRPFGFFRSLFGQEVRTFDYKWLRGINRKEFTGAHVDNVYMSRGTDQLYTLWTPFGDVSVEMGTLAVCEGSHKLPEFQHFQDTYGNMDVERDNLKGTGWFTEDPFEITLRFGGQWKTADFQAGDVLIFTMRTVHMSTANLTDYIRISCDTRWQPLNHPADPRYVDNFEPNKPRFGLHAQPGAPSQTREAEVTIEALKKKWGFSELSEKEKTN